MASPEIQRKIDRHGADIDALYDLLDATNTKLGTVADVQQQHGIRLDEIQQTLNHHEVRFDQIDTRFDGIDARFGGLEGRIGGLEGRFDGLEGRFGGMEGRFGGMEETQREILELLRAGQVGPTPK
ncbi:hypothetical protein [Actinokineospora sp.]|uniref:hypothetical protein n=1 Tax=Actinokineospora sp. TaxID=1872133 RepID=UPI0040376551